MRSRLAVRRLGRRGRLHGLRVDARLERRVPRRDRALADRRCATSASARRGCRAPGSPSHRPARPGSSTSPAPACRSSSRRCSARRPSRRRGRRSARASPSSRRYGFCFRPRAIQTRAVGALDQLGLLVDDEKRDAVLARPVVGRAGNDRDVLARLPPERLQRSWRRCGRRRSARRSLPARAGATAADESDCATEREEGRSRADHRPSLAAVPAAFRSNQ